MYKRIVVIIFMMVVCMMLTVSGTSEEPIFSTLTQEPTVTIAGDEVKLDVTELILSNKTISDLSNISQLEHLARLDIRESFIDPEDIPVLQSQIPQCEILWSVNANNTLVESTATNLDIKNTNITDIKGLIKSLGYLNNLSSINLAGSDISVQDYKTLTEECADIEIIYNVDIYNMSISVDEKEIDLTNAEAIDAEETLSTLGYFSELEVVNFGNHSITGLLKDDFIAQYPNVEFLWDVELLGDTVNSSATELDISNRAIDDYEALADTFKYLPNLEYVDMCDCNLSNQQMEELNSNYPNTKFVWKIMVGGWEMRTDIKAFSTGNRHNTQWQEYAGDYMWLTDDDIADIRYCTDLMALDIGHQRTITNLEFLSELPNLKYLIIAATGITDISPVANLSELEYLEVFFTEISDFSPLLNLPNLYHINCCFVEIEDIDVFVQMKQLKRLWISVCGLNQAQLDTLVNELPECEVEGNSPHSTGAGWRSEENQVYIDMMEIFGMEPLFSER